MTVTISEPIIQYLFQWQVSGHSPHHLPEALPWSTASHTLLNYLWWWASNSLVQNKFRSLCKCNTVIRIKQAFVGFMAKDFTVDSTLILFWDSFVLDVFTSSILSHVMHKSGQGQRYMISTQAGKMKYLQGTGFRPYGLSSWAAGFSLQTFWRNLRRWADKFCLHCNIFNYIRHSWIKSVV